MSLAAVSPAAAAIGSSLRRDISSEDFQPLNPGVEAERPLPPLPPNVQPPVIRGPSARRAASIPTVSSRAAGKRRAAPSNPSQVLARALKTPDILARVVSLLSWRTFYALSNTCRNFRRLLDHAGLRDIIFSEYVPGYRTCLGHASADRNHVLSLDMSDLALLKISQSVPLHHYPLHALKILGSSLYNIQVPPNDPLTLRYVSLTHTHSRFVLLLQSLAHGGLAFTSEIDADDYALTPPVGPPAQALSGLRELVFPQPLAVFEHADQFADQTNRRDDNSTMERLTRTSTNGSARLPGYSTNSAPHASADFQSLMAKKPTSKKLLRPVISALGGGQKAPPPPPQANPPALAYYVGAWRRNTVGRRPAMKSYPPSEDDEFSLSRPATRRSSSAHPSTASSIASSSPSTSGSNSNGDTDASSFSPRDTSKPPLFRDTASASRPNPASPHDLSVATSRFRAPLLRVFVPCSVLDEIAISMCEEQLVQAGLWDLLSTGDIICNFGFVPSQDSSDSQSSKSSAKSDRDCSTVSTFRRQWLIFNGYCLVHYIPPSPPPIERALTLPSPFYYSHILPANTEPRFVMSLPPLQHRNAGFYGVNPDGPFAQLTLSTVRTRVASPHSPLGWAAVKKYLWYARIPYVGPSSGTEAGTELGEGWQGEWVLEAEGTQEGKQQLLDAVKPGPDGSTPRGLWEIVRDKSGGGRIWIKLIRSNIDSRGLSSEQAATTPKI